MSDDPVLAARMRQALPVFVALSTVLLVVGVLAALYLARDIFVPVTLAILLSFVLVPGVRALRRLGLPRIPAVFVVVIVAFGILVGVGGLIAKEGAQLVSDLPRYQLVIRDKIAALRGATASEGTLSRIIDMVQDLGAELQPPTVVVPQTAPGSPDHPMLVEIKPAKAGVIETLGTYAGPILHPLATTGLILIFTIFILLQREDLRNRMIRLAGSADLRKTTAAIDDAASRLSRFFLAQLALNIAFGLVVGLGLWAIGVPSPTLFGVLAAVLRFVPYIGAAISAVFPLMIAAAVDPGWNMVIATAALFLIVEPIAGHVIEPLLYGHSTGISPVAVILAATIWTFLWGPIGLVLATPLTVCLVVLGRHVHRLWYLDIMLGDQPALSPPEIFYQRMLAKDPEEAIDQGRAFLKERALVTYYDEVALAGLLLAQEDLSRGTLDHARQEQVGEALKKVVARMGRTPVSKRARKGTSRGVGTEVAAAVAAAGPDRQVAQIVLGQKDLAQRWRGADPVLCISNRGPFDEAATAMLSQILDRHGLSAQVMPMAAIRAGERPTRGDPALICFSYLEPVSLSQIRFFVRQARSAVPGVKVLVGFWRERDPATLDRLRRATSADILVTSLNDALAAAVEAAREAGTVVTAQPGPRPMTLAAAAAAPNAD